MSMFWLWHEGVVLLVWIHHNIYRNVFCHYVLPGIASVSVIVHRLVVAYMVLQTFPICENHLIYKNHLYGAASPRISQMTLVSAMM